MSRRRLSAQPRGHRVSLIHVGCCLHLVLLQWREALPKSCRGLSTSSASWVPLQHLGCSRGLPQGLEIQGGCKLIAQLVLRALSPAVTVPVCSSPVCLFSDRVFGTWLQRSGKQDLSRVSPTEQRQVPPRWILWFPRAQSLRDGGLHILTPASSQRRLPPRTFPGEAAGQVWIGGSHSGLFGTQKPMEAPNGT